MTKTGTAAAEQLEISATRVFDAPRDLVWRTFTDPEMISNWWGPEGFTTTTHKRDLRPGGFWHHTMHGPDGTDYPNFTEFIEVAAPERLVYRNSGDEQFKSDHTFTSTVLFRDLGDQTELSFTMVFATPSAREEAAKLGAIEGLDQTLNRFRAYVAAIKGEKK